MDHSIEIDSNKKMRNEHVHPLTLQFLRADMESNVTTIIERLLTITKRHFELEL